MSGLGRPWRRTRLRILVRDRWVCHWCGAKANTVDHVVPRALGGGDHDANLVAACAPCNTRRGGELGASRSPRWRPTAKGRNIRRGAIHDD
jgi:5-methylcytosine-specific restriction endonuclease McrA